MYDCMLGLVRDAILCSRRTGFHVRDCEACLGDDIIALVLRGETVRVALFSCIPKYGFHCCQGCLYSLPSGHLSPSNMSLDC